MVADQLRLRLQLTAAIDGQDDLSQVLEAETALAAIAQFGDRLIANRLAAASVVVSRARVLLENEMLLDIEPQSLAAIVNADLLTVRLDLAVLRAEAFGAVLTLSGERLTAAAPASATLAARRLAILTNLHARTSLAVAGRSGAGYERSPEDKRALPGGGKEE